MPAGCGFLVLSNQVVMFHITHSATGAPLSFADSLSNFGVVVVGERFDLTMCNPPFHASMDEATKGSERKWRALGKADPKRKLPVLNFGGQSAELWCEGGEARFVTQLIAESAHFAHKVLWFSTLVSKASNLPAIETALKKAGVLESQVVEMSQGQKQSRFVAWTFQTKNEQQIWRQRWVRD